MQLHEVRPKTKSKTKKRVGRGGKRGTYSGRGQKGQKSRAGHRIKPAEREVILRTPKKRGYKNKPKKVSAITVSLSMLDKIQDNIITPEVLVKNGIIPKKTARVKILATGEIISSKEISGIQVSKEAKNKIEQAKGRIVS